MRHLRQDLAFGLRALRRRPGFAAAAVSTLALGIGATTAVFSVLDRAILQPLPFPEPGRLVRLEERHRNGARLNLTGATFAALAEAPGSFAAMGAFRTFPFNLAGDGPAEAVTAARVTSGYFAALGATPLAGRLLVRDDFADGAERVALVREGLWRRRFGGDAAAIGRAVRLDGEPVRLVGVIPERLAFPDFADMWLPMESAGALPANRVSHLFTVLARVRSDVPVDAARAELAGLAPRVTHEDALALVATPLQERLTEAARPALVALSAAVVILLAVACVNVATLLLARGAQRTKEMAVRVALGASRRRLVGQMLAESALLAVVAAPAGLALSIAIARAFATLAPAGLAVTPLAVLQPGPIAFALAVALTTAIAFGLWPARQAAHADLRTAMAVRSGASRGLVVAEVALLVVLMGAAGLLTRSSLALLDVPLGFRTAGVATLYVSPDGKAYPDAAAIGAYAEAVARQLRTLPGVREVSPANALPTTGLPSTSFAVDGGPDSDVSADVLAVGPEYFRAMGIPIVRGRAFDEEDRLGAPTVAVVSRAAADRFWPGADPVGRRLTMLHWNEPLAADVVGIVEDVRQRGPDREIEPAVYFSHRQFAGRTLGSYFVVRADGPTARLLPLLRPAVAAVDANQPADAVRTLDDVLATASRARRLQALLFGGLAAVAFGLVLAGIHGVLGRRVAERTREIGVRLALGAHPRRVLAAVVGDGLRLAAWGIAIGLPLALVAGRALQGLLHRIGPGDPRTLAAVVAGVLALALVGAWLPARRAARVDPMVCLRDE